MSERFNELDRFINLEMKMSHVYQPAMLLTLMDSGGTASRTEIAKTLLTYDKSQIEYYEIIVAKMQGCVLTDLPPQTCPSERSDNGQIEGRQKSWPKHFDQHLVNH
jgi:hypothetical protein